MDSAEDFWDNLSPMKHLLAIVSLVFIACSMTACNTMKGVGQDVSAGGRDISKAASTVERKIQN
jgi:entericidin B